MIVMFILIAIVADLPLACEHLDRLRINMRAQGLTQHQCFQGIERTAQITTGKIGHGLKHRWLRSATVCTEAARHIR